MVRGTFGNVKLRNKLVSPREGGITIKYPSRQEMFVYDAAIQYENEGISLIITAGKEYGTGS